MNHRDKFKASRKAPKTFDVHDRLMQIKVDSESIDRLMDILQILNDRITALESKQ